MNAALDTTLRLDTPATGRLTLSGARAAIALLVALGACACTTTVRQVGDAHPISQSVQTQPPKEIDEAREVRVAETALQNGDPDTAIGIFGRILAKKPDSIPALIGIGNTLYMLGDYTRADVNYRKALSVDPKASQALIGVARVAIQKRNLDTAIDAYRKILVIQPNEPLAAAGLGAALDMKGDHAAAQASMRKSLEVNPGDVGLSINLGLSLVLDGKLKEGTDMLQDVVHFPGAPPQARYDLALAYGLMGDDDTAARLLSDLPRKSIDDNLSYYASLRASRQGAAATGAVNRAAAVETRAVPTADVAVDEQRYAPMPVASNAARVRRANPVTDAAVMRSVAPPLPARPAAPAPAPITATPAPATTGAAIAATLAAPALSAPAPARAVSTVSAAPATFATGGVIHGRLTTQSWNAEPAADMQATPLASQTTQVQP